jgi:signal transduction histidine kinase
VNGLDGERGPVPDRGPPPGADDAGGAGYRAWLPWALAAGGGLVAVVGVGQVLVLHGVAGLVTPFGLASHALALSLGGVVAVGGVTLARADVTPARYPRVVSWCLCCSAALFVMNLAVMASLPDTTTEVLVGWGYNAAATGAACGTVGGLLEARAVERARRAERAEVRAEAAEARRRRLDYLNRVLRHEVLNNANVIDGYAELARERGDGGVDGYLETIRHQSRDIASVTADVRALIESMRGDGETEPVDLSAVLTAELADLRQVHRHAEVTADVPEGVHVMADDLLSRVFGNLLSNAVEHNDEPTPRVAVTAERTDCVVTVRVADNGPGVSASERSRLFDRGEGEHGVGLHLVRELVEGYGGRVELADTGPDGSVFVVTLPAADPDATRSDDAGTSALAPAGGGG